MPVQSERFCHMVEGFTRSAREGCLRLLHCWPPGSGSAGAPSGLWGLRGRGVTAGLEAFGTAVSGRPAVGHAGSLPRAKPDGERTGRPWDGRIPLGALDLAIAPLRKTGKSSGLARTLESLRKVCYDVGGPERSGRLSEDAQGPTVKLGRPMPVRAKEAKRQELRARGNRTDRGVARGRYFCPGVLRVGSRGFHLAARLVLSGVRSALRPPPKSQTPSSCGAFCTWPAAPIRHLRSLTFNRRDPCVSVPSGLSGLKGAVRGR